MILDKGQLLETKQMFRDAGEQWPVIIPEEEIRRAAPGTKVMGFEVITIHHSMNKRHIYAGFPQYFYDRILTV
ncbi:hypothetical protein CsSME_00008732 [Camellia sinensis var. sinensis]